MTWLRRFGAFWVDFLVGDSLVLAVGSGLAVVVAAGLAQAGQGAFAPVVLPVLVGLTLAVSLR